MGYCTCGRLAICYTGREEDLKIKENFPGGGLGCMRNAGVSAHGRELCEFCTWFSKDWVPRYANISSNQNPVYEVQARVQEIDAKIKWLFNMNLATRDWKFSTDEDVRKAQEAATAEVVKDFEALKPVFSEQATKLDEFFNEMTKHFADADTIIMGREATLTQELIDRVFGPQGPPRLPKKQKTSDN